MFERIDDLPQDVQALGAQNAALWLKVYRRVFAQTQDALAAKLAADGAVRKLYTKTALKAVGDSKQVQGWALLFTNAEKLDLHETYFSKLTGMLLHYYSRAPLWMEHGVHPDYGVWPIGQRSDGTKVYGHGVWMPHDLHAAHERYDETSAGVERGEYSYSSDSIGHYVDEGFNPLDGELRTWPLAGCSLTKKPAEPGLGPVTLKSFVSALEHYDTRRDKTFPLLKPEGARDALKERQTTEASTSDLNSEGAKTMDPQMLADLAAFFGVEPTVAAVLAAMQQAIAVLEGSAEMADDEEEMDAASLRSALGLKADASDAEVAANLSAVVTAFNAFEEDADEEDERPARNYDALKNARRFAEKNPGRMPHKTRKNGSDGRKNVNVNRGAQKPGLATFLRNMYSVKMGAAKGISYQIGPNAGYLLNQEVSEDILPALRDKLPLFEMGVSMHEMNGTESLTIPKIKSEPEARWVGEGQQIPEQDATVGGVTLLPKPLAAYIPVPNKYLINASVNVEQMLEEMMVEAINRAIMRAALYGAGGVSGSDVGQSPTGLKTLTGVSGRAVTGTSLGTNGNKPQLKDLTSAVGRIEDAKVTVDDTFAYLFAPRTRRYFADLVGTDGHPILRETYRDDFERVIGGYRCYDSTLIPINNTVGTSSDCSDIFAGVWRYMALGLSNQFEFAINPYAQMRSLITEIIAYTYADIAVLYDEAFEVVTGVRP